jgi:hypothetical protein
MTNLFFNTAFISDDSSSLEQWANTCFAPVRILFHGRKVEVWNQHVIKEEFSAPSQQWMITATAILLLIPSILLGTIAKFLDEYLFRAAPIDYHSVQNFDQNPYSANPLAISHVQLEKMIKSIKEQMISKNIWENRAFIKEVSKFMEAAYEEVENIFIELTDRYGTDAKIIAQVMANQSSDDALEEDRVVYSYIYFYDSLTHIYHLARSNAHFKEHPQGRTEIVFSPLKDQDQDPYFNSDAPQYRWRMLYNDFCNKLDEIDGLRKALEKRDGRFVNWAQPDEKRVASYGYPDTRPTFIHYPLFN